MSVDLVLAALVLAEEGPKDEDVVAGPVGFVIFMGLVVAVALLGWSLTRHLRKADRAADAGVFGEQDVSDRPDSGHESR